MQTTTSEIDEALTHLSQVPAAARGQAWHAYLDALLEQRSRSGPTKQQPTSGKQEK